MPKKVDPIDAVVWRHHSELHPNTWNPNHVHVPELKLLELSLVQTGWIQPVLVNTNGMIIDGFHRWKLTEESANLQRRYSGFLPVVVLDLDDPAAMLMTVRINRAKGTHSSVIMHELVRSLIDVHNVAPARIATEMGATSAEVDLLYAEGVFHARNIADWHYSPSWVPYEDGRSATVSREAFATPADDTA